MEPNLGNDRWARWAADTLEVTPGWHLRALTEVDIPAVQASVDDQVRTGLLMESAYGPAQSAQLVTQTAPTLAAEGRGAVWGIAQEGPGGTSRVLGVLMLHAQDGDRARVGFWLAAPARGRGVAAAAVRAVARETTGVGGLTGLTWASLVGNVHSLRVARAAGFRPIGTAGLVAGADRSVRRAWWAELNAPTGDDQGTGGTQHTLWAQCLVEIAAGAWQLQPMDAASASDAERVLPVSACVPTGVWAAKEITTARVDAIVALLHKGGLAWVMAQPATTTTGAAEAATAAAEVIGRYARRALGLTTP